MAKVKVYYNSACPVCDAGISSQRRRMATCATDVDWIDIHRYPEAVKEIGAKQEFVRERLHVVDDRGELQIGADAFHALWDRTPGQQRLAQFIGLPVVKPMTRWLYNVFAAGLYAWNRARPRW